MTLATVAAAEPGAEHGRAAASFNERKAAARGSVSVASGSTQCDSEESGAPPRKKSRAGVQKHNGNRSCSAPAAPTPQVVQFPAEVLLDLAGSTSAEVRRMNEDERALVHYKRRLRNRESAKRSRARRQATLGDIQAELEDLRQLTAALVERCMRFAKRSERQSLELDTLRKEKQLLESLLRSSSGNCSL